VALDAEKDTVIGAATMNLYVSELMLENIQNPYLDLKPSSEYVVDSISKTISNLVPKTTVDAFLENFVIEDEDVSELEIRVTDIFENLISGKSYVGTGAVIELFKKDTVYDRYTVILYGDVNGDGDINLPDYSYIRQHILKKVTIDGIRFKAANIAERDKEDINLADFSMIRQHIIGNYTIGQK
jgi:hypothetical protein